METTSPPVPELPEQAFPPFVTSADERERWRLCHAIATDLSSKCEPDGRPNTQFVWYATRSWYWSDIATGTPADATR